MKIEYNIFGDDPQGYAGSATLSDHNLSACPFCGSHDVEVGNTWTPCYSVECHDCGASGPGPTTTQKTMFATVAAAKRAHRRALLAAVDAWEQRTY